jgi:hypothetical protein
VDGIFDVGSGAGDQPIDPIKWTWRFGYSFNLGTRSKDNNRHAIVWIGCSHGLFDIIERCEALARCHRIANIEEKNGRRCLHWSAKLETCHC